MKRLLAFMLCLVFALLTAGCEMRGDTLSLDMYTANRLSKTLEAIQSGELSVELPDTETLPSLQAQILNHAGKTARIFNVYIYNESTFDVHIHGYAWFASGGDSLKGIYYNTEKKVSNSTYEIGLDRGSNAYFLYELLTDNPITLCDDMTAFLFFRYEDTEYVCAVNNTEVIAYWPRSQTLSS